MKRIHISLAFALALGLNACRERIDADLSQVQQQVPTINYIAYAHSDGSVDSTSLYLSESSLYAPKPLKVQGLSLTVNGKEYVKSDSYVEAGGQSRNYELYRFPIAYKPGDRVQLSLTLPSGRALKIEQTVLKTPILLESQVGAVEAQKEYDGYIQQVYPVRLRLTDIQGESNYYRLASKRTRVYYSDTNKDYKRGRSMDVKIDYTRDFILMNGSPIINENFSNPDEVFGGSEASNKFMLFDDHLFTDREANIRVYLPEYELFSGYEDTFYDPVNREYDRSYQLHHVEVEFWLEMVTREAYLYYKALGQMLNDEPLLEDSPFMTPTSIPSNIEGGTGFFGIFTRGESKTITIKYPETLYTSP